MSLVPKDDSIEIREVWDENLEKELYLISKVIDHFPYVAMDTEFPGTVCKPVTADPNPKRNSNQFNFREFNLKTDMFAIDSIQLLKDSGMDFAKNNEFGIDSRKFAELLTASGVVLNDEIQWVTFHCGYDFGYLLKLLTGKDLPEKQSEFFNLVKTYFPRVYDIKHLMDFCNGLYGGLSKVAELLKVERVGVSHQAGSDSLLTSCVFRKMKEKYFPGPLDRYSGALYGLGNVNNLDSSLTTKTIKK